MEHGFLVKPGMTDLRADDFFSSLLEDCNDEHGGTDVMQNNAQITLSHVLDSYAASNADIATSDLFVYFTSEQVLKDFRLSREEIETGITDGPNDGGVDAAYVLVNGDYIREPVDLKHLKKDVTIDIHIIQCTISEGFAEAAINKFIHTSQDFFSLSRDEEALRSRYNSALLEVMALFSHVHSQLASVFPVMNVRFSYSSKGIEVHPNVRERALSLIADVKRLFSNAICTVDFLGAQELYDLAGQTPLERHKLRFSVGPFSPREGKGFVGLVNLDEYYKFITDETGALKRHIFEANVRDYQGSTEVNREIRSSLEQRDSEDFWWLNNGVSIVAGGAQLAPSELLIEDPEVVNGLQTSVEIHRYLTDMTEGDEDRNVLVRVVDPSEEGARERIIKANNRQTVVPLASLRATDSVHRDIEILFKSKGLYYDRRKNHYRNEGIPARDIVSITKVAQAVMAIVLGRPNDARARPSTLLKSETDYRLVFGPKHPIDMYYVSAMAMRRVEQVMKDVMLDLERSERNDIQFHVGYVAVRKRLRHVDPGGVAKLQLEVIDDGLIAESAKDVWKVYTELGGDDTVAKGRDFVKAISDIV